MCTVHGNHHLSAVYGQKLKPTTFKWVQRQSVDSLVNFHGQAAASKPDVTTLGARLPGKRCLCDCITPSATVLVFRFQAGPLSFTPSVLQHPEGLDTLDFVKPVEGGSSSRPYAAESRTKVQTDVDERIWCEQSQAHREPDHRHTPQPCGNTFGHTVYNQIKDNLVQFTQTLISLFTDELLTYLSVGVFTMDSFFFFFLDLFKVLVTDYVTPDHSCLFFVCLVKNKHPNIISQEA